MKAILRLLVVICAYVLASIAAGTIAVAIAGPGGFGEPHETLSDILGQSIPLMALLIFGMMFGPAMMMIFIARHGGWRSWPAHAAIGAGLGLFFYGFMFGGPVLLDNIDQNRSMFTDVFDLRLLAATILSGAGGGFVYWLIANRLFPPHAEDEAISPEPSGS